MNFVLRSSVSPTYEFDNLSERQVHVGSGECKNRNGDRSQVAAPGQGSNAAFVFSLPAKGAHAVRRRAGRYVRWIPGQSDTQSGNLCWWNL